MSSRVGLGVAWGRCSLDAAVYRQKPEQLGLLLKPEVVNCARLHIGKDVNEEDLGTLSLTLYPNQKSY